MPREKGGPGRPGGGEYSGDGADSLHAIFGALGNNKFRDFHLS